MLCHITISFAQENATTKQTIGVPSYLLPQQTATPSYPANISTSFTMPKANPDKKDPSLLTKFVAFITPKSKELTPEQKAKAKQLCFNGITERLRELTQESLNEGADDPQKNYLAMLLDNQAEQSFIKFSRAFIKAGYFEQFNGETAENITKKLESLQNRKGTGQKLSTDDIEVIKQFFNSVQTPTTGKGEFGYDKLSKALQVVSYNDESKYWIQPADLLILKSIIYYDRPGGRNVALKDRLLYQMRNVFKKRNFAEDDLKQGEEYLEGFKKQRDSFRFKSAKAAFVKKAQKVINDYVQNMGESCRPFFLDENGKMLDAKSIVSQCSDNNYLKSLFSDDPLDNVQDIINFVADQRINWKSNQNIRVSGVKITPLECTVKDGQISLKMKVRNLPRNFDKPWELKCPSCTPQEMNNSELKEEFETTENITFSGLLPDSLTLRNSSVPHVVNVSLDKCREKPEPVLEKQEPVTEDQDLAAETEKEAPAEEVTCTEGQDKIDNKCYDKCPPGNIRNENKDCIPEDKQLTDEDCKAGQKVVDNKCVSKCDAGKEWNEESESCEEPIGCTIKNKAGECVTCDAEEVFDKEEDKCVPETDDIDDINKLTTPSKDTKGSGKADEEEKAPMVQNSGQLNLPQAQQIPIPGDAFYIKAGFN